MDFGEILTKAWRVIWKHKILWLFGVLAGCGAAGSSGGGGGGGSTSSIQTGSWNGGPPFLDPSTTRVVEDVINAIIEIPIWAILLFVLFMIVAGFILSILFLMLGSLGITGVIKGTGMAEDAAVDEKPLSLSEVFKGIKPHYWKVFLLNIGLRIAGFIVGIFLILPIIIVALCTCGLGLLLLIPIGWLIDLLVYLTTIAIIEEDKGIFEGIGRAWQVFTRNIGNVLLMFLVLGVGQFIIGLIIALPLIVVPVPLLIQLFATGFRAFTVGLVITILLSMVFVPLVIFLGGVLQAYVLAAWTITYRRLTTANDLHPTVLNGEPTQT